MTEQVLITMTKEDFRDLLKEAVAEGLKASRKDRIPLRPMDAARHLGVSFNTYKKMLQWTGRTEIYQEDLQTIKTEYHDIRKKI